MAVVERVMINLVFIGSYYGLSCFVMVVARCNLAFSCLKGCDYSALFFVMLVMSKGLSAAQLSLGGA
jgi:hypothetical protein